MHAMNRQKLKIEEKREYFHETSVEVLDCSLYFLCCNGVSEVMISTPCQISIEGSTAVFHKNHNLFTSYLGLIKIQKRNIGYTK